MPKRLNIYPGDRFGRLVIINEVEPRNKARFFLCKCDCGNEKVIRMVQLTTGGTKSCGCFKREHLISMIYRHGYSRTKLYKVWTSMKQRCLNIKSKPYNYYGSRGIMICDEWLDFNIFHDWALANGYQEGLTIERRDVNGNYCPENCVWIPQSEQSNNTRNNRLITYGGEIKNLMEWSKKLGINRDTLDSRLRRGWSVDRTLTEPVQQQHSHKRR